MSQILHYPAEGKPQTGTDGGAKRGRPTNAAMCDAILNWAQEIADLDHAAKTYRALLASLASERADVFAAAARRGVRPSKLTAFVKLLNGSGT